MMRVACMIPLCVLAFGLYVVPANAQTSKTETAAQHVLTNKAVLSMLKNGLPASIVAAKIKTSRCRFDTSPKELEKLKAEAVPDSVILAMVKAPKDSSKGAAASNSQAKVSEENGKPLIYVSDSQSWLMGGGFGAGNGSGAGVTRGGSSPQTVEVIKTFGQRCPQVIVTENKKRAAFVILFDRESFKGFLRKRDKIAVFHNNGDVVYSNSVRSVGSAVKDACSAILKTLTAKK